MELVGGRCFGDVLIEVAQETLIDESWPSCEQVDPFKADLFLILASVFEE